MIHILLIHFKLNDSLLSFFYTVQSQSVSLVNSLTNLIFYNRSPGIPGTGHEGVNYVLTATYIKASHNQEIINL